MVLTKFNNITNSLLKVQPVVHVTSNLGKSKTRIDVCVKIPISVMCC